MDEALLVAITVLGREQDRRRSREAGINLHLVKPCAAAADPRGAGRVVGAVAGAGEVKGGC